MESNIVKYQYSLFIALAFTGLFYVRVLGMDYAGFFDYDTVRNLQIIREVSQGNFQNLYHHVSPLFFLFYGLVYKIAPSFFFLSTVNMLINLSGILLLVSYIAARASLSGPQKVMLFGYAGSSLAMVLTARCLNIESLGLLLFHGFLIFYHWSVLRKDVPAFWWYTWGCFAALEAVNYRSWVFLPLILLLELVFFKTNRGWKAWGIALGCCLAPVFIFTMSSYLTHNDPLRYLKYAWNISFGRSFHPSERVALWHTDWLFYFRYWWDFESPLVWVGLPGAVLGIWWRKLPKQDWFRILLMVSGYLLVVMSVLPKALRGLVFVYPALYALVFWGMMQAKMKPVAFYGLVAMAIVYQLLLVGIHIYPYSRTQYPAMALAIQQAGVQKLTLTVGLGVVPFLPEGVETHVIFDEKALPGLAAQGFTHVLVDRYHLVSGIDQFPTLDTLPGLAYFREPTLLSPLLYLELAEYSGKSYRQMLHIRQEVLQQDWQLKLVPLSLLTDSTTNLYVP
jgi:hypothetical protein